MLQGCITDTHIPAMDPEYRLHPLVHMIIYCQKKYRISQIKYDFFHVRVETTYDTKIKNIYKLYLRIYKNNIQSRIFIFIIFILYI